MKTYRELETWQQAMNLAEVLYKTASRLPRIEQFGLAAQVRRAAVSVPANIAEGQGLGSTPGFIRHLWIAHATVRELETHVMLAGRFGYLKSDEVNAVLAHLSSVGKLIRGLIAGLERSACNDQ